MSSDILRAAFDLSAFSKMFIKNANLGHRFPVHFFYKTFVLIPLLQKCSFQTFPILLIMLKTIKHVGTAMRMAYFPIFENALRSAATPKVFDDRFFGFRVISSIDLIWFQPGNDDREVLVVISLAMSSESKSADENSAVKIIKKCMSHEQNMK